MKKYLVVATDNWGGCDGVDFIDIAEEEGCYCQLDSEEEALAAAKDQLEEAPRIPVFILEVDIKSLYESIPTYRLEKCE